MDRSTIQSTAQSSFLRDRSTNDILQQAQALIFEPHRRDLANCLFFSFGTAPDPIQTRNGLAAFADRLTTAYAQHQELLPLRRCEAEKDFRSCKLSLPPVINLSLAYSGCEKILTETELQFFGVGAFTQGMAHRNNRAILKDPPTSEWQPKTWQKYNHGPEKQVDLMIQVADNDPDRLAGLCDKISRDLRNTCGAAFLFAENGIRLANDQNRAIEPFGFRDGMGQVPFWTSNNLHLRKANREIVLDDAYGSYLVFRKLEQDVDEFDRMMKALTKDLFFPNGSYDEATFLGKKEFVEAQVFGRFKDGTPLAISNRPLLSNGRTTKAQKKAVERYNAYQAGERGAIGFGDDVNGLKCPFYAHSRKVNPRDPALLNHGGEKYGDQKDKPYNIRIARRGIPYVEKDEAGKERTGLLFMCYQASIENQFRMIQRHWCNSTDFLGVAAGVDPVIGRAARPQDETPYCWIIDPVTGRTKVVAVNFQQLITMQGGEYFYTPSVTWLKKLIQR